MPTTTSRPRRTAPPTDELELSLLGPESVELGAKDHLENLQARFTNKSDTPITFVKPPFLRRLASFAWDLRDERGDEVPRRSWRRCGSTWVGELRHEAFLEIPAQGSLVLPVASFGFFPHVVESGRSYAVRLVYELVARGDLVHELVPNGTRTYDWRFDGDEPGTKDRLARAHSFKVRSKNAIAIRVR